MITMQWNEQFLQHFQVVSADGRFKFSIRSLTDEYRSFLSRKNSTKTISLHEENDHDLRFAVLCEVTLLFYDSYRTLQI